jgi:NADPH2:quinone reductase
MEIAMTRIVRMAATGGPEVLVAAEAELPPPAAGEVRIRHIAAGVNFVDVYQRTGLYAVPALPAVLGVDGAGVVEALGADVTDLAVGAHVAYAGLPAGGYAEARNIPRARLVRIPEGIDDRIAAAAMLRGITAHMLLTRVHPVGKGTTMLVHAAAGGLGLILTQWAKSLGATVIGTVGSPAKAELARAAGLDHAILYRDADFAAETRRLTGGRGVDVAYDGIGGDTLLRTLDAVSLFGTVVSVGQAAGTLPQIPLTELGPRRSIALARPSVFAYANDAAAYAAATDALFGQLAAGLKVSIGMELDLAQAAEAHMRLERGETTGSILLRP